MKTKYLLLGGALLALSTPGIALSQNSHPEYERRELIRFAGDVHIQADESVREVIVIGGDVLIDGEVGELIVVMGNARINGVVHRDMVIALGSAELGTNGVVHGDSVIVGGTLTAAPGAELGRSQVEIAFPDALPAMQWFKDWLRHGLLLGRPLPHQLAWAWLVAAMFAFVYLMLALLLPKPMRATVEALENRPAGSLLAGVLFCVLIGPAVLLLLASVIGAVVIPFLFVAAIAIVLFGKAAILQYAGLQAGRQMGIGFVLSPAVALLIGAAILSLLYIIPFLGFLVWGLATLFGMGAVLMALFSALGRERGQTRAKPVTIAAPVPVMAGAAQGPPLSSGQPVEGAVESRPAAPPMLDLPGSERAGFTVRLGATLLDLVLVLVLVWMLSVIVPIQFSGFVFLWLTYHVAMWTLKRSTIGGLALGLQLARVDGRPLNFAVALVRALAGILSALPFFLGFFWVAWDQEKQSWHDKIAGTIIMRAPKGVSLL